MKRFFLAVFVFLLATGVSTQASLQESLFANDFDASEIRVRRVAVIPNRLPLNLEEAESWRKILHEHMTHVIQQKGFEVVDYETTVRAFESNDLPLDDVGDVDVEKYAGCADDLDADILIMPYLAIGSEERPGFFPFTASRNRYFAFVELQLYSRDTGKFIHRSDKTGVKSVYTGIGLFSPGSWFSCFNFASPKSSWRAAFSRAANVILDDFFAVFPNPS